MTMEKQKATIKDKFWDELTSAVENTAGNIIVAGDFNSSVGTNDGTTGENIRNSSGRKMTKFCILMT